MSPSTINKIRTLYEEIIPVKRLLHRFHILKLYVVMRLLQDIGFQGELKLICFLMPSLQLFLENVIEFQDNALSYQGLLYWEDIQSGSVVFVDEICGESGFAFFAHLEEIPEDAVLIFLNLLCL